MVFRVDHFSPEELSELGGSTRLDAGKAYHLRTCPACKRAAATSLLVGGLVRVPASVASSDHLTAKDVERFHAAAYEGEETDASEFLSQMSHLRRCDKCFARLFALHQDLTPSDAAVAGAVEAFSKGRSTMKVGLLAISRGVRGVTQHLSRLSPPSTETDQSLESMLDAALAASEPPRKVQDAASRAAEESPEFDMAASLFPVARLESLDVAFSLGASTEPEAEPTSESEPDIVEIDGLTLCISTHWDEQSAQLRVEATDSAKGQPRLGVEFTVMLAQGVRGASAVSSKEGKAALPLRGRAVALLITTSPDKKPWEVELDLDPGVPE